MPYKCKEKQAEYLRRYRDANREKVNEQNRRYYQANKEKENERSRRYRAANPEKEAERKRKYQAANREKMNEYNRKRYHKMGGHGYRRARFHLLQRDGHVCGICGRPFAMKINGLDWSEIHVDHIKPVAAGGNSDMSNLQLAHASCNVSKQNQWNGTEPGESPIQLRLKL